MSEPPSIRRGVPGSNARASRTAAGAADVADRIQRALHAAQAKLIEAQRKLVLRVLMVRARLASR
jgi:hypothetical protein